MADDESIGKNSDVRASAALSQATRGIDGNGGRCEGAESFECLKGTLTSASAIGANPNLLVLSTNRGKGNGSRREGSTVRWESERDAEETQCCRHSRVLTFAFWPSSLLSQNVETGDWEATGSARNLASID